MTHFTSRVLVSIVLIFFWHCAPTVANPQNRYSIERCFARYQITMPVICTPEEFIGDDYADYKWPKTWFDHPWNQVPEGRQCRWIRLRHQRLIGAAAQLQQRQHSERIVTRILTDAEKVDGKQPLTSPVTESELYWFVNRVLMALKRVKRSSFMPTSSALSPMAPRRCPAVVLAFFHVLPIVCFSQFQKFSEFYCLYRHSGSACC